MANQKKKKKSNNYTTFNSFVIKYWLRYNNFKTNKDCYVTSYAHCRCIILNINIYEHSISVNRIQR